jgi:hypothetical protein
MSSSPKYSSYTLSAGAQARVQADLARIAQEQDASRRAEVDRAASEIERLAKLLPAQASTADSLRREADGLRKKAKQASGNSLQAFADEAVAARRRAASALEADAAGRATDLSARTGWLTGAISEAHTLTVSIGQTPNAELARRCEALARDAASARPDELRGLEDRASTLEHDVADLRRSLEEMSELRRSFRVSQTEASHFVELTASGSEVQAAFEKAARDGNPAEARSVLRRLQATIDAARALRKEHEIVLEALASALQSQGLQCGPVQTNRLDDGTEIVSIHAIWADGRRLSATVDDSGGDRQVVYVADGLPDAGVVAGPVTCDDVEPYLLAAHEVMGHDGIGMGELRWAGKPQGPKGDDNGVARDRPHEVSR